MIPTLTGIFPNVTRAEFWCGIALAQAGVDNQDRDSASVGGRCRRPVDGWPDLRRTPTRY